MCPLDSSQLRVNEERSIEEMDREDSERDN